jgi:hypothetical protein
MKRQIALNSMAGDGNIGAPRVDFEKAATAFGKKDKNSDGKPSKEEFAAGGKGKAKGKEEGAKEEGAKLRGETVL